MRGVSKDRPRASWFARRREASSGDGASRLLTMRGRNPTTSTRRPLKHSCRISAVILPFGDIISFMMVKWSAPGISS